jgi:hypothetical protein
MELVFLSFFGPSAAPPPPDTLSGPITTWT